MDPFQWIRNDQKEMCMSLRRKSRALIVAVLAASVVPAAAHHSSAMYDRMNPLTVEAEVVSFTWVNPHSTLTVLLRARPGEDVKTWRIEMTSPGVLTRSGWTKRSFEPGDKITLEFGPLRSGGTAGYFNKAVMADGKVMQYDNGETTILN
jgi:hypothetical protein